MQILFQSSFKSTVVGRTTQLCLKFRDLQNVLILVWIINLARKLRKPMMFSTPHFETHP